LISLLTNKFVIGGVLALAVIAAIFFYGKNQYNSGFEARDLQAQVEMKKLENQILQKTTEARNREIAANKKAQDLQDAQIQELEKQNEELDQKLKENEDAAKTDPDSKRVGLSSPGVLRLNRIR